MKTYCSEIQSSESSGVEGLPLSVSLGLFVTPILQLLLLVVILLKLLPVSEFCTVALRYIYQQEWADRRREDAANKEALRNHLRDKGVL